MGGGRHVSRDLHSPASRSGLCTTRVSKENPTDKQTRFRASKNSARKAAPTEIDSEPLVVEEFESVWDALGFSAEESASLETRSTLMIQIREIIRSAKWTQAVAAQQCGVSQPRINDLLRGRIDKFSIDALVNIAAALGQRVTVKLEAA